MPAAGTISFLRSITIFTTGFKNGSSTYRQGLKKLHCFPLLYKNIACTHTKQDFSGQRCLP